VLLSRATGFVSNGNLLVFEVIRSKAREIVGDDIVTIGNEEIYLLQHRNFKAKLSSPKLRHALFN